MIRRIVAFAGLALIVAAVGCGRKSLMSHWATTPLAIDGDGADWPVSYTTYVEDTRGVIGVANDDSTVYLLFRFRDEKTARKAMVGGVTAWWSPRGTKDRDVGLRFTPVVSMHDIMFGQPPPPADAESGFAPEHARPDSGLRGGPRSPGRDDRGWTGFGRGLGRAVIPAPEEGVLHRDILLVTAQDPIGTSEWSDPCLRVHTGYKKGTFTYEVALPLGAGDSGIGITPDDDSRVYISVTLGGVPKEDQDLVAHGAQRSPSRPDDEERPGSGSDGGPPSGGSGGLGGGEGRGPGGRGPGAMRNPLAELAETIDVSFSITLATSTR